MTAQWFEDLSGVEVPTGSRPVGKIYVIDPERAQDVEWILAITAPETWEQVVRTNVVALEALAAHADAYESRGDARRAGYQGPPHHGLELYGPLTRSFWVWCPQSVGVPVFPRKRLRTQQWWDFMATMGWLNRGRTS